MIELRDLKGDMHDLAATIGVETTFKLCTLFGGDNIYIPRLGGEEDGDIKEIREILGEYKYQRLIASFGGATLYFPTKNTILREHIARSVKEEYDGSNRRELMRKYGLTKTGFYRIVEGTEKAGPDDTQQDEAQMNIYDFLT